ncbi:MAG: NAD(P)H-dependent oxidoreductase subunit E [Ostreibacterium sp.]
MKTKTAIFKKQRRGRQVDPDTLENLRHLLSDADFSRDKLIEYLHIIQDTYGYIDDKNIVALANLLKLSPVEVYEVASFYHHFDIVKDKQERPPKITVRVCDSMSCSMFGAEKLIDTLDNKYQGEVRIQRVPCIGTCHEAPNAVVGKNRIGHAKVEQIDSVITTKAFKPTTFTDLTTFDEYFSKGGYKTLSAIHNGHLKREIVIGKLKSAAFRGLGGAGFPTGVKWEIVSKEKAPRFMVVNLDEGEPGTIKDGYYLAKNPHQFIEGMLIASSIVDCQACYIYLRDEYASHYELLKRELSALGKKLNLILPPIHLRRGAGSYICGEESALIESLEGKRGMPRLRPPFVANVGLFNRPTLVNNFETLYWIPTLLEQGAEYFTKQGVNGRVGMRSYSVSGRVKKPGVYLAPAGTTVQTLIDDYCGGMLDGHEFYGYFPGGASGGILPATLNQIPLDFDTLQEYGCFIGSAAIIVFSDQDRARDMASLAMSFFKHESCGQCTPCSVGTDKANELMKAKKWDTVKLNDLSTVMQDASICGLGQAAPNPMLSVIKYFPNEIY